MTKYFTGVPLWPPPCVKSTTCCCTAYCVCMKKVSVSWAGCYSVRFCEEWGRKMKALLCRTGDEISTEPPRSSFASQGMTSANTNLSQFSCSLNQLKPRSPKIIWQFWLYHCNTGKSILRKIFEGEMLSRTQPTTLLQIFCKFQF